MNLDDLTPGARALYTILVAHGPLSLAQLRISACGLVVGPRDDAFGPAMAEIVDAGIVMEAGTSGIYGACEPVVAPVKAPRGPSKDRIALDALRAVIDEMIGSSPMPDTDSERVAWLVSDRLAAREVRDALALVTDDPGTGALGAVRDLVRQRDEARIALDALRSALAHALGLDADSDADGMIGLLTTRLAHVADPTPAGWTRGLTRTVGYACGVVIGERWTVSRYSGTVASGEVDDEAEAIACTDAVLAVLA